MTILSKGFFFLTLTTIALTKLNAQTLKQVNIEISKDSIQVLEDNPFSNDDVLGNFIVDGIKTDKVEIHYRGAWYLWQLMQSSDLRNWKVKFAKDQKFENRREWNFNYEDYIRQNLAYHLFKDAGVPCISTENVILSINGKKQGLYLKYEDPDNKDWLADTFGDDEGDLYKAAFDIPNEEKKFADFSYLGDNNEDYFLHYRKQTNKKGDKSEDYSSVIGFLNFTNNTSDETFEKDIETHFNVHEFIKYLVVANYSSNWDSYPSRPKNFFIYNNPKDKQWHFIPWDVDGTFQEAQKRNSMGSSTSIFYYMENIEDYKYTDDEPLERPLAWRIMAIEKYRNLYLYEYKIAMESYLSSENILQRIDSIAHVVEQNTSGQELSRYQTDVNNTKAYISARSKFVSNELDKYQAENPLAIMDKKVAIELYPNPASSSISINLTEVNSGFVKIDIFNYMGIKVLSKPLNTAYSKSAQVQLNIANLVDGNYIIKVISNNEVISKRFSIVR